MLRHKLDIMRKTLSKSYEYIKNLGAAERLDFQKAREASEKLNLDGISLSSVEAQILQFFVDCTKAEKVVEIGTLTGLSALYMLQVMPTSSCLWTLEKSPQHAAMASDVLAEYIKKNQCKIIEGDALESLKKIEDQGPFDAVFIDGNKAAYLDYFNWSVKNVKTGGVIIADNVFLSGAVWGDETKQRFNEKQIAKVKEMNCSAFQDKNLRSIIIPTEEGMLICKKLS